MRRWPSPRPSRAGAPSASSRRSGHGLAREHLDGAAALIQRLSALDHSGTRWRLDQRSHAAASGYPVPSSHRTDNEAVRQCVGVHVGDLDADTLRLLRDGLLEVGLGDAVARELNGPPVPPGDQTASPSHWASENANDRQDRERGRQAEECPSPVCSPRATGLRVHPSRLAQSDPIGITSVRVRSRR